MRRGRVGLCVATQIGRYSPYFHRLPGWNSPEQAWAQTAGPARLVSRHGRAGRTGIDPRPDDLDRHLDLWLRVAPRRRQVDVVEVAEVPGQLPIGCILSLEGADSIVTLGANCRRLIDDVRLLSSSVGAFPPQVEVPVEVGAVADPRRQLPPGTSMAPCRAG